MTLEPLMAHIADRLAHGPIDVRNLVGSYYPDDMEAGLLIQRAFHAGLLRGRLQWSHFDCTGRIVSIADDTRPVWH